jgi:hypothetical protein
MDKHRYQQIQLHIGLMVDILKSPSESVSQFRKLFHLIHRGRYHNKWVFQRYRYKVLMVKKQCVLFEIERE